MLETTTLSWFIRQEQRKLGLVGEYDLLSLSCSSVSSLPIFEKAESQARPIQVNEGFASLDIGEDERNMLNRLNGLSSEQVIWKVKSEMMTVAEIVTDMVIRAEVLLFDMP